MKRLFHYSLLLLPILSLVYLYLTPSKVHSQSSLPSIAIISDSSSDEYRAEDKRGGSYGATTLSWNELLFKYRNLDFGPWGTRSEPRRSGYEYNWARSAARTVDMISTGQHTGVAQQVSQGKIDLVFINIGINDFGWWNNQYQGLYNGTTDATQKANTMVGHIRTAVETVQAAGNVPIILATVPDINLTPHVVASYPDATKRQRVTAATNLVNQKIKALVVEKNLSLFDTDAMAQQLLAKITNGNLIIAGETISFSQPGDEPHHFVLGDNIHGGTVAEGLFANYFLNVMNTTLGTSVPQFSDTEIVQNAGITIAGVPTSTPILNVTTAPTSSPVPTATSAQPTLTVTPRPCPEDINGDLFIDISDYAILVNNFLVDPLLDIRADIDGDGMADLSDYSRLVGKFLQSCE